MTPKQLNRLKQHPKHILMTCKDGIYVIRKQTVTEKYAEKIVQYFNSMEFSRDPTWDSVGKKVIKMLRSYKRASK